MKILLKIPSKSNVEVLVSVRRKIKTTGSEDYRVLKKAMFYFCSEAGLQRVLGLRLRRTNSIIAIQYEVYQSYETGLGV